MTGEELKRKGVYLDSAATSYPKPDVVAEEMMEYLKNNGVTSARGAYKRVIEADKKVYEARKYMAKWPLQRIKGRWVPLTLHSGLR